VHPKANLARQYSQYRKCVDGKTFNFLMAGMLPETQYVLQQEWTSPGQPSQFGPEITFTTGAIPDAANLPAAVVLNPRDLATDAAQPVLLTSYIATVPGQSATPVATDFKGRTIWYYGAADKPLRYVLRPLAGGTILVIPRDPTLFREIDLAGNTVRETNTGWISEQLQTRFGMPGITSFHHDAVRLPDGSIAAIASLEKVLNGVQGSAGPVDVLGDAIVVMDRDFNVTWAWNSFDKLDAGRAAVLGETCVADQPGCPPVQMTANDWLHSNSLEYLPDGNFLLSLRHQDWVVKIDYRDGAGTGGVLWRLGKDGDFAINSSVANPWFSHQHNVTLSGNSVWLFDNGNTRHSADSAAVSRGQVLNIDENARTVSLAVNADLGNYSPALGSAERLDNGNFHFLAGSLSNGHSQSIEIVPSGSAAANDFTVDAANPAYRSFRMKNLSTP
ncbi:MAG: aryl-sulfate sulfotransferase, partial [Acidobacteriota bacterium]|nr:aryl-sulfate sulfotransferase [Acidobacteriota bacterium]